MKSSDLVIRPGTQKDVEDWYGKTPALSMRVIVGELDGKVIAIGGVYRDSSGMIGIAGLKDEMRSRKKDIARMVREGKKILQNYPYVVAFADKDEKTAPSFLGHLGFVHQRKHEIGEAYVWRRYCK